jgi:hypothetical protein
VKDEMPRYRFECITLPEAPARAARRRPWWDNRGSGAPLRRQYGARPREDFVRDLWDVLREEWLGRDATSRNAVVVALSELGLDDVGHRPTTKSSELEYRRSCRNAKRLREAFPGSSSNLASRGERSRLRRLDAKGRVTSMAVLDLACRA